MAVKKPTPKAKARTQVCFLLDETQSMLTRKEETIKGFNGYLEELKKDMGDEVLFTFTTFNRGGVVNRYKAVPIGEVEPLTDETYNPRNWTPLYDAVGTTACALKDAVKKEDLVIFAILTDGEENSSQEYTQQAVKDLITKHEKDGWKFTYLGVGVDAFKGGASIGLAPASSFFVGSSGKASTSMYGGMAAGINAMRGMNARNDSITLASTSVFSEKDRKKLQD